MEFAHSAAPQTAPTGRFLLRRWLPDVELLFALALCAFSLWALLYRPGLPNGDDVLYHVYRTAEMDRSWAAGLLTPRWAQSFYTGYGSPVFHYYAGASYYAANILSRLFALNIVDSLRALIMVAMLGGAAGMYTFVRPFAGKLGGVIAAVCFTYSPYILLTEPYTRGAYPEMSALALFPWVLAAFSALLRNGGGPRMALAALGIFALIMTHNLMAVAITGVITGWMLWLLLARALRRGADSHALRGVLALALGVGLGAFFWLPIFAERDAVRLDNLTAVDQLNYRNFFVPLGELLAFSPRPDAGAINGLRYEVKFGVAQWTLAALGVLTFIVLWLRRMQRPRLIAPHVLYFSAATLICLILMLPPAAPLWEAFSPLALLQFPWRLLGLAAVFLALLAGLNAMWIARLPRLWANTAAAIAVLLPVLTALPNLYVDEWEHLTVDTSVAAYHAAELAGLQRGTTFSNEYLPRQVIAEAGATQRLLDDFADGEPVNRANLAGLPPDVTLTLLSNQPQESVWQVSTPDAFTLELLIYNFPGWAAEIDGTAVPITSSEPHGLITLPVPAGDHTLRVYLGSTPPRAIGNIISALALVGVVLGMFRMQYVPNAVVDDAGLTMQSPNLLPGLLLSWGVALLAVIVLMRPGMAWIESPPGQALIAQQQVHYDFDDQVRLIGYDLHGSSFQAGDTVEITLYWYAPNGGTRYGYASFVHISQGGAPVAQADKLNPAGEPTVRWSAAGYLWDSYSIVLPASTPAGTYSIVVGLYTCDTRPPGDCGNGERPTVTDREGQIVGDAAVLTTLNIR